jgi:hypothetical protein
VVEEAGLLLQHFMDVPALARGVGVFPVNKGDYLLPFVMMGVIGMMASAGHRNLLQRHD